MMRIRLFFFRAVFIITFFPAFGLPSLSNNVSEFPENAAVRNQFKEILLGSLSDIERQKDAVIDQISGPRVRITQIRIQKSLYLEFLNERNGKFPITGKGSIIIKRDTATGAFVQFKLFLLDDEQSFIRVFPVSGGRQTKMDVYIIGRRIHENVVLPLRFDQALTSTFSYIMKLTDSSVYWNQVMPGAWSEDYETVRIMAETLKSKLKDLKDEDDGAQDENGKFVYINDRRPQNKNGLTGGFNCSGFAKWVADSQYYPKNGRLLAIEPLKEKHLEDRGNDWSLYQEKKRDPYFGLDWTRNIAAALYEMNHPGSGLKSTSTDLRNIPYLQYSQNTGYLITDSAFVMYMAALKDPGKYYLGSISVETGNRPTLRQHVHVAVFFPWFDEEGAFHLMILERGYSSTPQSLAKRYPNAYVHFSIAEASTELGFIQ